MRWQPRRSRRFSAYRTGDYWVTVEWLAHTDDPLVRWVWTTRTIQFVTAGGAVVLSTPFEGAEALPGGGFAVQGKAQVDVVFPLQRHIQHRQAAVGGNAGQQRIQRGAVGGGGDKP